MDGGRSTLNRNRLIRLACRVCQEAGAGAGRVWSSCSLNLLATVSQSRELTHRPVFRHCD